MDRMIKSAYQNLPNASKGSEHSELKESFDRSFKDALKLHKAGHLKEAAEIYSHIVARQPDNAEAWFLLSLIAANHDGDYPLALALINRAIACNPRLAHYHALRGVVLERRGQLTKALAAFDQALRLKPDCAQSHYNRGVVLEKRGRLGEALAAFDQALRLKPDCAQSHYNRGVVLEKRGRLGEALAAYDEAVRFRPDCAQAHNNRGLILRAMGRLTEALAAQQQAVRVEPDDTVVYSNYLFSLNYDPSVDDAALFAAHRRWSERFGRPPNPFTGHDNVPDPERTLRVGLVSADFGQHPIGYFIKGVLAAADPTRMRFLCYSGRLREDELTERLKAHAAVWRSTIGASDRELAETIRADGVDILIDLAGHTAGNRLTAFALRAAPVQATWLGYLCTTGLAAIDYILLGDVLVPPEAERWFVERVVKLGPYSLCYAPPEYAPKPEPPPLLRRGYPKFGSFNNLAKVTPEVVRLWSRVLRAVPGAQLLLKWSSLADLEVRAHYFRLFEEQGVVPERLELRGRSPHVAMLGEYADVDVALDPFPFAGGLTSAEALWMGVPVVTLLQTRPVSRQSQMFLVALERPEWVGRNTDDYVRIAAGLVSDPESLAKLRREQRERMAASPVCDATRFTRHLERALRDMWRAWCASANLAGQPRPRGNRPPQA